MRWVCCLILAGLTGGCIEPQLQVCGDQLCAPEAVCLPSGRCASATEVEACNGVAPGGTCSTPQYTGSCVDGACTAPRCGDGIVSGSEQCDGSVGALDCADYGFDLGLPACSAQCTLEVVGTCVSFGWERVLSVQANRLWTDGARTLLVTIDRDAVQLYDGDQLVLEHTGPTFYDIASNGSVHAAASDDGLWLSTGGAAFERLPHVSDGVAMAPDGVLYFADQMTVGCEIARRGLDGTVTVVKAASRACSVLRWTGDHLYVAYLDGVVERWNGSAWSLVLDAGGDVLDVAEQGGVVYLTGDESYRIENGTTTLLRPAGFQVIALPDRVYIGGESAEVGIELGGSYEYFSAPIAGRLATDGTSLYIYGTSLYRFTGMQYALRAGTGLVSDMTLLADGSPVAAAYGELAYALEWNLWGYYRPGTVTDVRSVAGNNPADVFMLTDEELLWRNGGVDYPLSPPVDAGLLEDLAWDPVTRTLHAVGTQRVSVALHDSQWATHTPPPGSDAACTLARVAPTSSGVYAAGACGSQGIVWQLAGTAWTEIHRGAFPLASIAADVTGNLYAVGPTGLVRRIDGTWSEEPAHGGISVSATGPGDVWIGGGTDEVEHWDGTTWSRLGLLGASSPHVIATARAVYIAGASTSVLLR